MKHRNHRANTRPTENSVRVLFLGTSQNYFQTIRDQLICDLYKNVEIDVAFTKEEAHQLIQAHRYDAVLLDDSLASQEGERHLPFPPYHPVALILLTDKSDAEREADMESLGARDCLPKSNLDGSLLRRSILYSIECQRLEETIRLQEERYHLWSTNSSEAHWCFELKQPVSIDAPEEEQIKSLFQFAYLSECNDTMAQLHDFADTEEMIGTPLHELALWSNSTNTSTLSRFIRSGYNLRGAEFYEYDKQGQVRPFWISFSGVIEDGYLVRLLGTQRDMGATQQANLAQARLAAIVESSHHAIFGKTLGGRIFSWNRGAEMMYGYPPSEVVSRHVSLLAPPDRVNEWATIVEIVKGGGWVEQLETVRVRKDGTHINVSLSVSPIVDSSGQIIGASTIAEDITERKKIERGLSESEARFRTVLENSRDIIYQFNVKSRTFDYISPAIESLTGYSQSEVMEGGLELMEDLLHPEDRAPWSLLLEEWTTSSTEIGNISNEYRLRRKDGSYIWCSANRRVLRNEEGYATAIVGNLRDITQSKLDEAKLRESETRLRRFRDANIIGVIVLDLNGQVLEANDIFLHLVGYTRTDLERGEVNLNEMTPPNYQVQEERAHQQLLESATTIPWEQELICRDGDRIQVLIGMALLEEHSKQCIGFILDISEIKRAEASLKNYAAQLERSNNELQDFAYVASHDLQEPLRKILAFGDRLQEDYSHALDENAHDYLNRMTNAAGRMQTLIKDLLAFSRLTTKQQEFVPVALSVIVKEVLSDLETRVTQTDAQIEVGNLPTIEADALQMRQLLQNLISNALKFQKGASSPVIKISAEVLPSKLQEGANTSNCRLQIQDNGIGFEEKQLDRIFMPFQRLHHRGSYEGTGMGLAICRRIAERHEGSITAESTPGKGSTFIVTLPTRQPPKKIY